LAFSLPTSHPLHGRGRCAGWVSLVDVVPTLLELMQIETPDAMRDQLEGRSLVDCMRGEPLSDAAIFAESGKSHYIDLVKRRVHNDIPGRIRAVVADGWKLVWTPFAAEVDAFELYDLASDPNETRNLFRADHPRVPALRQALREWMERRSQSDDGHEPTAADLEALRALGYVE
jgi:arylsulfatase A-like enzyme